MTRSWIAGALCIVVCASFAARAAGQVIEARYFPEPAASTPPTVAPPPQPHVSSGGGSAEDLVSRNPFCSDCEATPPGAGDPPSISIQSSLVLVATMLGPRSIAAIRDPATGGQGAFAVGDRVPGGGTISEIQRAFVLVSTDAGVARLELGAESEPAPETKVAEAGDPRVRKISDTSYEIDRTLLSDLVTAQGKVPGVRVGPAVKDGKIVGARISHARKGSLADAVGLKTGDIIEAIDGQPLDNATATIEAYGRIQTASTARLTIRRAGKPLDLDYRFR